MNQHYFRTFWVYISLTFLLFGSVNAQSFVLQGNVTAVGSSEPLIGVSVVIKGTSQGMTTDLDGSYSLTINGESATVVFSFIGYSSKEYEVNSSTGTLDVSLSEDVTNLEEVVITGLASSIKRSNLANSIATVSGEELVGTTGQPTIDGALYGKMTGVNIVASGGAPGGGTGVRLRGISSIKGNNQPLYIIDGVYMNNAEIESGLRFASGANRANEEGASTRIADLNPNDIESVEVLKGASAAAIYGTRANAGVIIITTKRGKQGRTKVTLSQDIGISKVQNLTGPRQWNAQNVEATFGAAEVPIWQQAVNENRVYDYEEELYGETGIISNTNLGISGGDERTTFYIGASIRTEEGIIKGTGFDRNSFRINLTHKLSDRITITSNSNYINSETQRGFTGNENEGGLSLGYNLAYTRPWYELHADEFGNYADNPTSFGNMFLVRDVAENDDEVNRFIQGVQIDYDIIKKPNTLLKFKFNGGLDFFVNESFIYVPETHQGQRGLDNGFIGVGKNTFKQINYQSFLVFDKYLMGGDLRLSTQAGISYLNFDRDFVFNQTTQLIPGQKSLEQGGSQKITQNQEEEEEFGFILQQEANYKDQFIGTLGIRSDKSSLNGDPNKYYNFLKASLAVNITNFDFWNIDQISQLKLRAAYGETGSSAVYGSLFTVFDATNIEGRGGILINEDRGTPDLFPETSTEFEFGFDAGILDGLIGVEFTVYNRKVNDLLFDRNLPTSTGFETEVLNDADLENKGVEIGISARPISNQSITWNTTLNWWKNESTLTRLGVDPFPVPENGFGLGLGTFFLQEGTIITNIVQNDADGNPVAVGNTEPDFQMSWYNEINFFRNFDFTFLFHWKKGGDVLNLTALLIDDGGTNPFIDSEERGGSQYDPNFFYVEEAGYIRLREVALYYSVPSDVLRSAFKNTLNGVRVGVSGRNLWTDTDYSGYDPEVSVNGSGVVSNGLDVTPYPSSKQFYFHINLTF